MLCVWRTTWKVVIILFFLYDSHRHSQTKNKNQAKKKSNFIYPPRANQLIYYIYKYTYYWLYIIINIIPQCACVYFFPLLMIWNNNSIRKIVFFFLCKSILRLMYKHCDILYTLRDGILFDSVAIYPREIEQKKRNKKIPVTLRKNPGRNFFKGTQILKTNNR